MHVIEMKINFKNCGGIFKNVKATDDQREIKYDIIITTGYDEDQTDKIKQVYKDIRDYKSSVIFYEKNL